MATITFDSLNIYVANSVPTNRYLKVFLFILNTCVFVGICYFVILLQQDEPNILPFLLPIFYFFSLGKYLLWNIFGEETYIISTSHISYQHSYGFWKTKLKTSNYKHLFVDDEDSNDPKEEDQVHLTFVKFNEEKLQQEVFRTALTISYAEALRITAQLNELNIEDFGQEVNFPRIFSN